MGIPNRRALLHRPTTALTTAPTTALVTALIAVLALTLAPPDARADVITLKGGETIEGEILSETAAEVRIKTRYGAMTVQRSRIESIVRSKSVKQEFAERRAALKKDDAEAHWQLSLWARKNGLRKDADALVEDAARIDPLHKGANEALGRILFEGKYVLPEEKEKILREREDAGMASRGLVRYKDRWVTPEEKDARERGLVPYKGGWVTEADKMKAEGYVRYRGEWIKKEVLEQRKDLDRFQAVTQLELRLVETKHFRFFSVYDDQETRRVAAACEKTYSGFLGLFGIPEDEKIFYRARCRVFLLQKTKGFERMLKWMVTAKEVGLSKAVADFILRRGARGTYFIYPEPFVVGYQFPDPFESLMGRTIHKTGHILLHGWRYDARQMPWWLTEGLGCYWEISVLGRCDTFFITLRGYGDAREGEANKWKDSENWKIKLKTTVNALRDPDIVQLRQKELNDLDHLDVAKSWSIMSWLIETRRERFVEFIRLMKEGLDQDKAGQQAFGANWPTLDKEWREYVRANY